MIIDYYIKFGLVGISENNSSFLRTHHMFKTFYQLSYLWLIDLNEKVLGTLEALFSGFWRLYFLNQTFPPFKVWHHFWTVPNTIQSYPKPQIHICLSYSITCTHSALQTQNCKMKTGFHYREGLQCVCRDKTGVEKRRKSTATIRH